ncbi:MAG: universal stress protein [Methanosarcinaceae archaeon]|nr:universal stress protein [Methanosarcinaceae archaeon]
MKKSIQSSIEWMENAVKSSEFKNVPEVTFEVIHINPGENLAEKVAVVAVGFDMIVMGHCKYKKIYKFLHESVAEDLICISPCPVMIVPVDCGNAN